MSFQEVCFSFQKWQFGECGIALRALLHYNCSLSAALGTREPAALFLTHSKKLWDDGRYSLKINKTIWTVYKADH